MTEQQKPGYTDTPYISGSRYRVHDADRPQPRVVTPGTESTQEQFGLPPSDAVVLFDGSDGSGWRGKDGSNPWKMENDYMEVVPGTGNITSVEMIGDCQMHIEWASPELVVGDSQGRGNSGVFLMGMYEIQVLDCYDNPTYPDGATGGIYGQCPPLVNACRRPGDWQTYDIVWVGPRFDGDKLVSPARLTLFHNGLVVQHDKTLLGPTMHQTTTWYRAHASELPLILQDHGDLVRYRNIWYRPLLGYDE